MKSIDDVISEHEYFATLPALHRYLPALHHQPDSRRKSREYSRSAQKMDHLSRREHVQCLKVTAC